MEKIIELAKLIDAKRITGRFIAFSTPENPKIVYGVGVQNGHLILNEKERNVKAIINHAQFILKSKSTETIIHAIENHPIYMKLQKHIDKHGVDAVLNDIRLLMINKKSYDGRSTDPLLRKVASRYDDVIAFIDNVKN